MLIIKALFGALIVIIISFLSKSKNYYIVGLVPLFPTFALIGHLIVAKEQGIPQLKETILFGMWSLLPYLAYLISLYFLIDYFKLTTSLLLSVVVWIIIASLLVFFFKN